MRASSFLTVVMLLPACGSKDAPQPQPEPAVKLVAPAEPVAEPVDETITWIEDDWAEAQAQARARGVPIVADMWAPWCHTCLSMQQTVLVDPSLRPYASRFVWLAVDTDKPQNEALLANLDMQVWPTFFVLDPEDGSVLASFGGAASVDQFRAFLADAAAWGERELPPSDPLHHVREGTRAMQAMDYDAADEALTKALALAPADWSRRADVLVDQIRARAKAERWQACVELAEQRMSEVAASKAASTTDFSLYANRCAGQVDAARGEGLRRRLVATLEALAADPDHALSVDDRSDLLANLRAVHLALDEAEAARAVAERQRELLAEAAKAAPPELAMAYNWQRVEVAVFLGEGEALIPELEASIAALPEEYDPPYRLAWLLLKLERPDEALPWAERALGMMYGPRKASAQRMIADIHAARGDAEAERAARAAEVEIWKTLPPGQQNPKALERAEAALAKLD